MSVPQDFCPFVGIEPYTEADRDYFFGRNREQRIIISNLYAAPLTVLYGSSGVGKTSVLQAGVVPKLRAAPRTAVIVFRHWQDETFTELLKAECVAAIETVQQKPLDVELSLPLDEFLSIATQHFQGTLLIIFDQFEEYFLYHPTPTSQASFEAEFARAVNREEIDANFLLALREDGLAKLDRFKSRIPALLSNLLPLHHMDLMDAEDAIREPLKVYNDRLNYKNKEVSIEDDLINAILDQVRIGQVQVTDTAGSGEAEGENKHDQIEEPFLQLVMTRLWEGERRAKSYVLRYNTLKQLGGAQTIVRTHLDSQMKKLQGSELDLCARIFDRLVTPSGSKIAIKDKDLSQYAGDLAGLLPVVLQKLSASDARVLRSLPVPGAAGEQRYEIYHDVLAAAILEWRSRFMDELQETSKRKQRTVRLIAAALIMLVVVTLCVLRYSSWKETRPWGAINNLSTGSVYLLKNTPIYLGRNVKNIGINSISISSNFVSRIHLVIDKNLRAIDMRTLNGTTVNQYFLAYGESKELENGDIIVLASVAPLQFEKISYAPYQFWNSAKPQRKHPPPGTWGMFLDLVSKKVSYLTEGRYFVSDPGIKNFSIGTERTDNWLFSFGINRFRNMVIEDRKDSIDLIAEVKTGETYTYRGGIVPPGKEFPYFAWKELGWNKTRGRYDMNESEFSELGVNQAVFHTSNGMYFRILYVVPDLEPGTRW